MRPIFFVKEDNSNLTAINIPNNLIGNGVVKNIFRNKDNNRLIMTIENPNGFTEIFVNDEKLIESDNTNSKNILDFTSYQSSGILKKKCTEIKPEKRNILHVSRILIIKNKR